jgi:hypothetical protein
MLNIDAFAREKMNIILTPLQIEMIKAWVTSDTYLSSRMAGKTTARRVLDAWVKWSIEEGVGNIG